MSTLLIIFKLNILKPQFVHIHQTPNPCQPRNSISIEPRYTPPKMGKLLIIFKINISKNSNLILFTFFTLWHAPTQFDIEILPEKIKIF